MKEHICRLATGTLEQPVVEAVAARCRGTGEPPLIWWCEPVNGPRPLPGFVGLGALASREPPAIPLTEARLYYDSGMLHLLTDGNGSRWAAWWEGVESPPAWCPPSSWVAPERKLFVREPRKLLLAGRRKVGALERGLSGASTGGNEMMAVEYYDQGVLRWWRLTIHAQAESR